MNTHSKPNKLDKQNSAESTRVTLGLMDGVTVEGTIKAFKPQTTDLHIFAKDTTSTRPSIYAGEQVAYIAFHRCDVAQPSSTLCVKGRKLKVHTIKGPVFKVEVESTALSNPLGFYAKPLESTSFYEKIFFYAHGVAAKEDARPLGEMLVRSGALDSVKLKKGLVRQEEEHGIRIGEVLVETEDIEIEVVEEAASLQKRRGLRLGELLIESGWITEDQLMSALAEQKRRQGKRIGEVLMEMELITEDMLSTTLANKFLIPLVDLDSEEVDPMAGYEIPKEVVEKYGVLPIRSTKESMTLAISDPLAVNAIEEVRFIGRKKIVEVMVRPSQLKRYVAEYLARLESEQIEQGLEELLQDVADEVAPEKEQQANIEEVSESDSTIIRLVNRLILDAYRAGASDIHVEPGGTEGPVVVRLRVDGVCRAYQKLPSSLRRSIVARIKIMANLDISERRKPQDGKIRLFTRNGKIELRVATLPTVNDNEDVVLRILASSKPMPPEQMRFSKRNLKDLLALAEKPYGLLLVVGPTGSGKTTTLHSVLGHINTVVRKIWTAEDPVEITQTGLRQVQMQPKIGLTFANALRAFLRADPDVIMVGEMRDHETATIAVEASLTGHLVFSTLHTNSAPETITRLVDMGLDPFSFADALLGVLAQRLARSLCMKCRESYRPSDKEIAEVESLYGKERFEAHLANVGEEGLVLWRGKGCSACSDTGYKGRVALHELLVPDDTLRTAIGNKEPVEKLRELAALAGMTTLMQDGIEKALSGITDIRQVVGVCVR